jgi:hypothetical protein
MALPVVGRCGKAHHLPRTPVPSEAVILSGDGSRQRAIAVEGPAFVVLSEGARAPESNGDLRFRRPRSNRNEKVNSIDSAGVSETSQIVTIE